MLSFNNSFDIASHLPFLYHIVTLLVSTDSLTLLMKRNVLLRLFLAEFSLSKFYALFGLSKIALSILQLEENQLYASDLTLIERNLHTFHHILNLFENTDTHQQQTLERIMMDAREP
ncbi:unnamed protein product [Rotaria sordida]|uniref:Uncharacterized protein n=1 Tax=Rotaria sordida TaxID=392033 RepID=A0A815M709_9BILA|nr:unnamed protein product [Rotaria sordida]